MNFWKLNVIECIKRKKILTSLLLEGYSILYHYSCGLSTATIEFSCPSVCLSVCVFLSKCVSVYTITKKNDLIHLKLEHIVAYEKKTGRVRHWVLSDQGQGHGVTVKLFSIYHNTNCQVLYLSFDKVILNK